MATALAHMMRAAPSGQVTGKQDDSGSLVCSLPVVPKHVSGPFRLVHGSAGQHFLEDRRQVDDGSPSVRVQVRDVKIPSLDSQQSRVGDADSGRPPVIAVDETSGRRPVRIPTGTPRLKLDVVVRPQAEVPDDLQVAELLDALEGTLRDARHETDDRLDSAFVVVKTAGLAAYDRGDHRQLDLLVEHASPLGGLLRRRQEMGSLRRVSLPYGSLVGEDRSCSRVEVCGWPTASAEDGTQCSAHLHHGLP